MKHSPGPWHWEKVEGYGSSWLCCEDGTHVIHSVVTPNPGDEAIIAAAPEMLEALKKAHDFIALHGDEDKSESFRIILRTIQSAISKA